MASATKSNADDITDFNVGQGDVIDISAILTGYGAGPLSDFVQLVESGSDTLLKVDVNGSAGGARFVTIAVIDDLTGLDAATLVANGNLVVT